MGRVLLDVLRIMISSITDNQPYDQSNQTCKRKTAQKPWKNLGKCNRITDDTLDIMRHKGRCIHRHCMDLHFLGVEHKGIQHSILRKTLHSQRRKVIYSLIERSHRQSTPEVQHTRLALLGLGCLHRIQLPLPDHTDIGHQGILYLRKGKLRSLLNLFQVKSIKKLIGYKDRIPFLQRLKKRLTHLHDLSLCRHSKRHCQSHQIYQCLTHILSVFKQGHQSLDIIIAQGYAHLVHIIFHKKSRRDLLHISEPLLICKSHLPVRCIHPCILSRL